MSLRCCVALGALIALGHVAMAAPPAQVPIQIDFAAPAGCSHAGAFYAGVVARTNRVRRAKAGEQGTTIRVRLTKSGGMVHGELSVMGARGVNNTRKVDGGSCSEVVEVLSLTVALALDPAAAPAPTVASAPAVATSLSPASPPGSAPPLSPSPSPPPAPAPVSAPSLSPVVATPAPPAPVGSEPRSETPTAPLAAKPPVAEASITAPPLDVPPPPDSRPNRTTGVDLGARAVVAHVLSPYVSLGGAVSVVLTRKRADEVPIALGLALLHVPNDLLLTAPDVVVRWTAVAITGCPPVGLQGRVRIQPCLLGIGGWLTATDQVVATPTPVGRAWWSAGALLRTSLFVGGGFSIDLDVGFSVPLVKRRFIVTDPDSNVGETPSVSAVAGIGGSLSL